MSNRERRIVCARCDREKTVWARGLCRQCGYRVSVDGTLHEWGPTHTERAHARLSEFDYMRSQGFSTEDAIRELGIKPESLLRQMQRHRYPAPIELSRIARRERRARETRTAT